MKPHRAFLIREARLAWASKLAFIQNCAAPSTMPRAAGFSQFMRHTIKAAGLPIDCKPHGLRKTLGRRMADDGCTAHQIMAVLGHPTLAEAERYTRDADRRRGGHEGIAKLKSRTNSQTSPDSLGKFQKEKE